MRKFFKWTGALIGFTFLLTLVLRFLPIFFTPLMLRRAVTGETTFAHHWVSLDDISPNLVRAVVSSEDDFFRGHYGFSLVGIETAMEEKAAGKRSRGGSTISQQTAKNVFTFGTRTWVRKGIETYYTVLIECLWGKRRIMEVYLNSIEMGPGIYGAEAASEAYFGCHASELTTRQAALIAAALPDPRHRDPGHPSSYLSRRAGKIQRVMRQVGPQDFDWSSLREARARYKKYEKSRKFQHAKEKMQNRVLKTIK